MHILVFVQGTIYQGLSAATQCCLAITQSPDRLSLQYHNKAYRDRTVVPVNQQARTAHYALWPRHRTITGCQLAITRQPQLPSMGISTGTAAGHCKYPLRRRQTATVHVVIQGSGTFISPSISFRLFPELCQLKPHLLLIGYLSY